MEWEEPKGIVYIQMLCFSQPRVRPRQVAGSHWRRVSVELTNRERRVSAMVL
jgi:hypothetical protein